MQLNWLYFCGIPINKASLMHAIKAVKLPMLGLNLAIPNPSEKPTGLSTRVLVVDVMAVLQSMKKTSTIYKTFLTFKMWIHKTPHWMVRMDDGWLMVSLVSWSISEERNTPEKGNNIHRVRDTFSNQAYQAYHLSLPLNLSLPLKLTKLTKLTSNQAYHSRNFSSSKTMQE